MKKESSYFMAVGECLEKMEDIMQELSDKIDETDGNPYFSEKLHVQLSFWQSVYTTTIENFFNK